MGLKKVLVTHAEFPSQSLTGDEQKALVDEGALIEHCFTTTYTNKAPWDTAFANIRKTGVAKTVISTDLGQTINPPVAEGFAMFVQKLLDAGFSATKSGRWRSRIRHGWSRNGVRIGGHELESEGFNVRTRSR